MSALLALAIGAQAIADDSYARCAATVRADPVAAERQADGWRIAGGGLDARRCLGLALAAQRRFPAAAAAFEEAARAAEVASDPGAATAWAQAGNAWLAANDHPRARRALDAALAAGTLTGLDLGEALLDRARAAVAADDTAAARSDLNAALKLAADDPLAWLLSATLARRDGDLTRARADIAEALRLSPDDASVQLEAGNVAASAGDARGARAAWQAAARIAPDGPVGRSATAALAGLDIWTTGTEPAPRPLAPTNQGAPR